MKLNRPLLVIDVETTGLHPERNSVLALGLVVVSQYLYKSMRQEWQIRLENPFEVLTKEYKSAQRVHGISTRRALLGGESMEQVVKDLEWFHELYPDAMIAGNNVGFDFAFIKKMFDQAERPQPFDYHLFDLTSLAAVHLGVTGLSNIAKALGLDETRYTKHSAIGDAELTADCLIAILEMLQKESNLVLAYADTVGKEAGEAVAKRLVEAEATEYLNDALDKHGL